MLTVGKLILLWNCKLTIQDLFYNFYVEPLGQVEFDI